MGERPGELFDRCLARHDGEAWREFVRRNGHRIRRQLRWTTRRCGLKLHDQELDELVQEFYYRLLAGRKRRFRGRSERELWNYLCLVARSLAIDRRRELETRKRRRRRLKVVDTGVSPEEALLRRERRRLFFDLCREVVRQDRQTLELQALGMALLDGWSSPEVARRLRGRVTAGRVDTLVFRLRKRLARRGIRLPRRR